MSFFSIVFGVILVLVGLKTIITREATLSIRLWGRSSDSTLDDDSAYSVSEHSGFIAVLIGLAELAAGIGMLATGENFLAKFLG